MPRIFPVRGGGNARAALARGIRGYRSTLLAEMIIVVGTLLIFNRVADRLGPAGFAEYQLARATLTSAEPVLVLGLTVALPRFVARSIAARGGSGVEYLRAAAAACAGFVVVLVPVVLLCRAPLASVFLGSAAFGDDIAAILVAAVGVTCGGLTYGYLRGRQMGTAANVVRVAGLVVAPVVAVFTTPTIFWLVVVSGALVVAFSLAALAWAWPRRVKRSPDVSARPLLSYSLRRIPGDLCSAALLTIPTIFAAHLVGLPGAGFVGFGTSLIALATSFIAPIGYVLVPYLSGQVGAGRGRAAYGATRLLPLVCGVVATAVVVVLHLSMDLLVRLYLGPAFAEAAYAARLMAVSSIPLAVFYGGRSIIDAFYDSPRNAHNLMAAVATQVVVSLLLGRLTTGLIAVSGGLFAGCCALGLLTLLSQRRIDWTRIPSAPVAPDGAAPDGPVHDRETRR